ncbi:MAG: NUDIX domain-containing protein [Caulobacteraceae bacterium]|nr:NUDIX domain-containing protein [Caulobacteraceae bacterium]
MPVRSAGLVVYRMRADGPEVLLVHPGGPFWARRDMGAWSIPKGMVEVGEDPLSAALREFAEEVGEAPSGPFAPLTPIRQKSGKIVTAFGVEADVDLTQIRGGGIEIEMEWPRGSGGRIRFPEIDRAAYFAAEEAMMRILPAQAPLIAEIVAILG